MGDDPLPVPGSVVRHELAQHRGPGSESGDPVDDVHDEMEPVHIVEHQHVKRSGGRALLHIAADVQVVVSVAPVGEPVNERRVAVIGEDHRFVGSEQRVILGVAHPVRVLRGRLQPHQVDHIDNADAQVRQVLVQNVGGRQHLDGRNVTGGGEDDIRLGLLA